jgi:PKD repeat protein
MKFLNFFTLLLFVNLQLLVSAQNTTPKDDVNGDWTKQHEILYNTSEADIMVRTGDIDNLGFGWPENFDPFTGNPTPYHAFPWTPDSTDAPGTDRIFVITSYDGNPPFGKDGYTASTSRPENLPEPIVLNYDLQGMTIASAVLQIFADDFQAPLWGANYFVSLNGIKIPEIATVINALQQTGPIGKIVNVAIPQRFLYLLQNDTLSILFDDTVTGAGDGYAIDFVKLLINSYDFSYTGKICGFVFDQENGQPVEEAVVHTSGGGEVLTDENGYYIFNEVPSGITNLMGTKFGYDTATLVVDLITGDSVRVDFMLNQILEADFVADQPESESVPHTVQFTDLTSLDPTSWEWDFGDGSGSEEQNPQHTYTEPGTYTVSLTASNGADSSTKVKYDYIKVGITGIKKVRDPFRMNIAPNPLSSKGLITFYLSRSGMMDVSLYDLSGQKVKNIAVAGKPGENKILIGTNDLPNGVYILKLKNDQGYSIKKLVVDHENR